MANLKFRESILVGFVVVGGWLASGPAIGQAVAPTPEQIELLRSLPPEEQQALIDKAQESMSGTAPLVGVGEKLRQPDSAQSEQRAVRTRPFRDADGDGLEDEPISPKSVKDLRPFGYEVFRRQDSDFEPEAAIPVPNDYVLGPGDRLEVQLFGNERGNYVLIVGRDGQVRFPKLGPVSVGGMRFEDVRSLVTERVAKQFVGTEVSISMGELRSIRVFVLGDVARPGSYLVSALSTISNALLTSGGIAQVGSLRDVQLKRDGSVVSRLDLYDLLLSGDSSGDARLLAGDVIFVPPVGATVAVFGEVNRPAIYEVRQSTTLGELLYLSGGLKPMADPKYARLERVRNRQDHVTVDVDLSNARDRSRKVESGDVLFVTAIRSTLQDSIELTGEVQRPRTFQFTSGAYLTSIIGSLDDLADGADPEYVLVRHESEPGQVDYQSINLRAALLDPRGPADLLLRPRDRIIVLKLNESRSKALQPNLEELSRLARLGEPSRIVTVGGVVRSPGEYPLESHMRISDLLRASGSPADSAYPQSAELTRYTVINGERRETEVVVIDLAAILRGESTADVELQPFDVLTVKRVPEWAAAEFVVIGGDVRFPGTYPIRRGETLRSVLARAGGVLPGAYVEGAVFTRAVLREREKEQIEQMTTRLRSDLALLALRNVQSPDKADDAEQALIVGRGLLADLQSAKPIGRLVIDGRSLRDGESADIELRSGDSLFIPRRPQSVSVLGEVQSATSHLWREGVTRDEYIRLSGGVTAKADNQRIYVVRADGSVIAGAGGLFSGSGRTSIQPGDTVVVPIDAERMRSLTLWTSVTQIIYNLAIAVAAVNSF